MAMEMSPEKSSLGTQVTTVRKDCCLTVTHQAGDTLILNR